ncbi:hypothetical protein GCM10025793_05050 [Lysobacter lycopersici]
MSEMSMLVKGTIDMRPDGSVESYALDDSGKLSPAVAGMVGMQVSQWRFEPTLVDGKPVRARTKMQLRIVAKPADTQNFDVHIQSAYFWGDSEGEDERISVRKKTSRGPMVSALMSTGLDAADLYLALKIGPDGKVEDAIVEQVNLPTLYSDGDMARLRRLLSQPTLKVVRQWTFNVPTKGERAGQPYWSGFLPVTFRLSDQNGSPAEAGYGEWRAYIPGPCTPIPWRTLDKGGDNSHCGNDAAPEGVLSLDNSGPKLLTPLMQG